MAHKCILAYLLFTFWGIASFGQPLTLDKYANQLYFNIFSTQPDPSIQEFIRLYIPTLAEKKTKDGIWIINPNKSVVDMHNETHSFIFQKHPFFKSSITSGKMEFHTIRNKELQSVQITNLILWFEFDTQPEAEMAFSSLIETFIPISTNKKISSTQGAVKAEFLDAKESKGFNKIRIRLTADNLDKHLYKILFETDNDL